LEIKPKAENYMEPSPCFIGAEETENYIQNLFSKFSFLLIGASVLNQ